ncbi:MAG TPA: hypothetical protein VJ962_01685 [Clostridia bacterium]|nr:hypothetical protein [Clostridia bacterium]
MWIKKSKVYNYYKFLSSFLFLIGISIFALSKAGIGHAFFNGLATSFLMISVLLFILLIIKRKDQGFKDDLDQMSDDERIKQQYMKCHSILNHFTLLLLVIMVTFSVFHEFSFHIGGTILLWTQIIGSVVIWFVNKKYNILV